MKDDKINNLREELMNEIKDIKKDVREIRDMVLELPQTILEKSDSKYASKTLEQDVYFLNDEINKMKDKSSDRNYEWLKYLIMIGVGALLAYFGLK